MLELYPLSNVKWVSYESAANMFLRLDSDAMYRCPSLLTAQVMRWDPLCAWSPPASCVTHWVYTHSHTPPGGGTHAQRAEFENQ